MRLDIGSFCSNLKTGLKPKITTAISDFQYSFNNKIYSQVDLVAMGSPLGPTLAIIFIEYLESKLVDELSSQALYIEYMNNCLVISQAEEVKRLCLVS